MLALTLDDNVARWMACKAVGALTPRVFWSSVSNLKLRDIAAPPLPGPEWVRLRTILGGICGTDLSMILQRNHPGTFLRSFFRFPIVLGHENVAVIEETGESVTGWEPGTRVVVEPALSCAPRGIDPVCPACAQGCFSVCENFHPGGSLPEGTMIGLNNFTSGSWAPRFVAHFSQLHAVPDAIDDRNAVLIDPLACALHGVLRRSPQPGEQVLIQGAGIVGLGVLLSCRALGYDNPVTVIARHEYQARRCREAGASHVLLAPQDLPPADRFGKLAERVSARRLAGPFGNQTLIGGFDLVYDCVGTGASLSDAMKFARARGTVVALGTSSIALVDTTPLWFSELTVIGGFGRQMESRGAGRMHTYDLVMELIRTGRLVPGKLLTHTFSVREYRNAFELLTRRRGRDVVKVAFHHDFN